MAETIYKVLEDCEVKKLAEREYEFTASTSTQDRDGEVVEPTGWDLKNFKKNPVIMYAHDYRGLPVGKAPRVWVSDDNKLKNTIQFPPQGTYEFADIVERLVDTGYLKTESVGFIPKKWEDGDGEKAPRRTYTKQELLEISLVPIPSNPDALRNAVSDGVITTKEFEVITKPEETDDYIRIPVSDCQVTATIDISKKEGIKALYCGEVKKVRAYLFDKRPPYNWTMARAKKWVEEHKSFEVEDEEGKIPAEKPISQEELKDELDYIRSQAVKVGFSPEAKDIAWDLIREVMRLQGDDIPFDIEQKVKVVLVNKNIKKLNDIKQLAQEIIESAKQEPSKEDDAKKGFSLLEHKEELKDMLKELVDEAQGKI